MSVCVCCATAESQYTESTTTTTTTTDVAELNLHTTVVKAYIAASTDVA